MTDKELIKALRYCGSSDEKSCRDCPAVKECHGSIGIPTATIAADRLEALLKEIETMRSGLKTTITQSSGTVTMTCHPISKWVSVNKRLPELTEDEIKRIEHFGFEFAPEFIVLIKGADAPTVLRFDGEKWFDDDGTWYRVEYWHSIPEPPSTEGV